MVKILDIVILGATGLTGKQCIPQMYKLAKHLGQDFTWGIAGRSQEKLANVLEESSQKMNTDLSKIPIEICDIENEDSMLEMAQKTRLVINCVGPYILNGEKVVEACLKAGTHYIDACGEPQFMERIQLTKHVSAKDKGVYIVSACGFDSIPSDLGIIYLAQKFRGILNSVVTYLKFYVDGTESLTGYTTWVSLVHNVSRVEELKKIRQELFKRKLPNLEPKLEISTWPHKRDFFGGWIVPFPGSDRSVMRRTQSYFFETEKRRPIQIEAFIVFEQLQSVLLFVLISSTFSFLSKYERGRKLLLDHPEIFSGGLFTKNKITENRKENSRFQLTLYGEGWREDPSYTGNQNSFRTCNKRIIARIEGNNPRYEGTGLFLVSSAITLLSEMDKLPSGGGVYTPGAAFGKTSLMELLLKNGISFDIVSEEETLSSKL